MAIPSYPSSKYLGDSQVGDGRPFGLDMDTVRSVHLRLFDTKSSDGFGTDGGHHAIKEPAFRPTVGHTVTILSTENTRSRFPHGISKQFAISRDARDQVPYQVLGHDVWLHEKDVTIAEAHSDPADAAAGGCAAADAAAGGSRGPRRSSCPPKTGPKPSKSEVHLQLPGMEPSRTSGGAVASSGTIQLERGLNDAASLHSRAMEAIDRISKQHAALRRFPMACPSCGSLNAPPGMSWGSGDIAACQGCGHSFVPLGHGMQDGDMSLLRQAVQEMRIQSERAQYLEQALHRLQQTPSPPSAARQSKVEQRRAPPVLGVSDLADTAAQHCLMQGTPPITPSGGMSLDVPQLPERRSSFADRGNNQSSQPRLVSLMDTQDLLTNSSCGSSHAPCFNGNKLQHREPTPALLQNINRNINSVVYAGANFRSKGKYSDREDGEIRREDGECTSASVSEGEISSSSGKILLDKHQRLAARTRAAIGGTAPRDSSAARSEKLAPMQVAATAAATLVQDASLQLKHAKDWSVEIRIAAAQVTLFVATLIIRALLGALFGAAGPALITAMLSSGAMAAYRSAQWSMEIEMQRVMDTDATADPRTLLAASLRKSGGLHVRLSSRFLPRSLLSPSIEDSLCLAVLSAQLALHFFFENWGLQGPRAYRWIAIAGHAVTLLAVLIAARCRLLPATAPAGQDHDRKSSGVRGGDGLWFSLTLGHWASVTWAAVGWWHSAAWFSAEAAITAGITTEAVPVHPMLLYTTFAMHVPIIAAAVLHIANFWNACRAQQPVLLFGSVVLAGLSMAASCYIYCSGSGVGGWLQEHWRASLMPLFCIAGAWVLWQELVRSLSID